MSSRRHCVPTADSRNTLLRLAMCSAGQESHANRVLRSLRKEVLLSRQRRLLDAAGDEDTAGDRLQLQHLEKQIDRKQGIIAALATLTLLLSVVINEICSSVDYLDDVADEPPEFQRWAQLDASVRPARSCSGASPLKWAQTLMTLVLAYLIIIRTILNAQRRDMHARMLDNRSAHIKPGGARAHNVYHATRLRGRVAALLSLSATKKSILLVQLAVTALRCASGL